MEIVSGKIEKAQKLLLYGTEGIGKSTFASKFPEPLFIDTEGSTNHMDVRRTRTPTSWSMLKDQLVQIKADPSICKTLVIDTVDWAERLCASHICETKTLQSIEDPGYGKGYTMLAEEFGKFLNFLIELTDLGIHVVLTAHAQIKQTELPEETGKYEFWTLKLEKKTTPMVKEWADLVLFANYRTILVEDSKTKSVKARGGQRYMYTTHRTTWDAKNRHGLPEELEFDYAKIAHIFDKDLRTPAAATAPAIASAIASAAPPAAPAPAKPGEDEDGGPDYVHGSGPSPTVKPPMVDEDGVVQEALPSAVTPEAEGTFVMHDWRKERIEWKAPPIPEGKGFLKPLYDLMETNGISDMMIREIVAGKGFATLRQPLENYPEDLVSGLLVGQWDGTVNMIDIYQKEHCPF